MERLNKYLAHAGVASRRQCDELIGGGHVSVDGQTVRDLGTRVDPEKQKVAVDGQAVRGERLVYWLVNKPRGYLCTNYDPAGRPRAVDLVPHVRQRVYTVGRLDEDSEGLLLLTNDGELANRLMHPRYGVSKTYLAEIHGPIGRDLGKKLKQGVKLADGFAKADDFRVFDQVGKRILVEVTLHEGRKHIVRRLLAEVGFPVQRLARIEFGAVKLRR